MERSSLRRNKRMVLTLRERRSTQPGYSFEGT
jgi:hypothetical protein